MDDLQFKPKAKTPVVAWSEKHQSLILYIGFWSRLRIVFELLFFGRAHLP